MNIHQTKAYGKYLLNARNEHSVHSPFLFKLLNEAFYHPSETDDLKKLDSWYASICQSTETFQHTDLGAGSQFGTDTTKEIGKYTRNVTKSKKYRHLIYHLCRILQPNTILELGTATGISTGYMAMGNPKANVITLEGCPELAVAARRHLRRLNTEDVSVEVGHFKETLSKALVALDKVDMAYIDGHHEEVATGNYFEEILEHCQDTATILVDDIYWSEGMTRAWEKIKAHPRVRQSVDVFQFGIVFLCPNLSKQDFTIRY